MERELKNCILANDGITDWTIVIIENASREVINGACKLADYLRKSCKADFKIEQYDNLKTQKSHYKRIFVGDNGVIHDVARLDIGLNYSDLEPFEYAIKTTPENIFLIANDESINFAVDAFLEEYIGCRIYYFTESIIPSRATIVKTEINIRRKADSEKVPSIPNSFDDYINLRKMYNKNLNIEFEKYLYK